MKAKANETTTNHNRSRGAGGGNSGYKYIQSVKEGDIAAVKSHLDAGVDINFVDMATEPRAVFEEGHYNVLERVPYK